MTVRYFPNPPEGIDQNSADAAGWRREVAHELNIDEHIEKTAPVAGDFFLMFSVADNNTRKVTLGHCAGSGGIGTVTSVGMTVPAEFSVSPSSITASGTFAITKATETANTVWAGPTTGAAAQPTFRALVAADLPTQPYIVSGTFSGVPATNQYLMVHTFTIATSFASSLPNSSGFAEVAATGSTAIDIRKRLSGSTESSIGTMTFGAAGTVPTYTFSSTVTFAIGDSMVIRMGTADATLADFGWSIRGTR